jgi:hypothetical protein
VYNEIGTLTFSNGTDCYGKIIAKAKDDHDYEILIYLQGCFGSHYYGLSQFYQDDIFSIGYSNYYSFEGQGILYFNLEHGILRIENEDGVPEYILVE